MSEQVRQIAMRITDLREISDCTVAQMAAMCDVSEEEYARYESGETDIPISFLLKLNEIFHVDMTELLTGEAPRLNLYSVTRAGKGQDVQRRDQYIYKNLGYNFVHRKIEPLYVTIPTDAYKELHPNSHEGQEFDYILEGVMKIVVSPCICPPTRSGPVQLRAQDSSVRTVVVPTATTRPPRARQATMASRVAAGTSDHSLCMVCSARFSVLTG